MRAPSQHGTPEQFASKLAWLGIEWISLIGESTSAQTTYTEEWLDTELPLFAAAARARGIAVYMFGYPEPSNWLDVSRQLARRGHACQASGIVVNPEAEWMPGTPTQRAAAVQMMDWLNARGWSVGMTSYGGGPDYFSDDFPWAEFAARAAYGRPQLYTTEPEDRPSRVRRGATLASRASIPSWARAPRTVPRACWSTP